MNNNVNAETNSNESNEISAISDFKNLLELIASKCKPLPPIAVWKFEEGCFGEE